MLNLEYQLALESFINTFVRDNAQHNTFDYHVDRSRQSNQARLRFKWVSEQLLLETKRQCML